MQRTDNTGSRGHPKGADDGGAEVHQHLRIRPFVRSGGPRGHGPGKRNALGITRFEVTKIGGEFTDAGTFFEVELTVWFMLLERMHE